MYTFYALQPGTFPIGPLQVTVDRVNHPVETYGVRLEHNGRVLAYSALMRDEYPPFRLVQGGPDPGSTPTARPADGAPPLAA